ncbi:hypothetical protein D3C80_1497560 [compost metagenome]
MGFQCGGVVTSCKGNWATGSFSPTPTVCGVSVAARIQRLSISLTLLYQLGGESQTSISSPRMSRPPTGSIQALPEIRRTRRTDFT